MLQTSSDKQDSFSRKKQNMGLGLILKNANTLSDRKIQKTGNRVRIVDQFVYK